MSEGTKEKSPKHAAGTTLKRPRLTKEERRSKYVEIARKRREKQHDQNRKKQAICFHCRQRGHLVADCPGKASAEVAPNVCYKCGSTEHALSACPKRHVGKPTDLPFANCFLCKQMGHLVSQCPNNTNGIYVNGGECRNCGSREHLASACPTKQGKSKSDRSKIVDDDNKVEDLLEPDVRHTEAKPKKEEVARPKRKVVKF